MEERLEHMRKVCARVYSSLPARQLQPAQKILADDNHRLLYCWMSKVACTAFKTLLLEASGIKRWRLERAGRFIHNVSFLASRGIRMFSLLQPEQLEFRIRNYFAFLNVRHPLERLISLYRDKIQNPDSDVPNLILTILRYHKPKVFTDPLLNDTAWGRHQAAIQAQEKYPITFGQFIDWLAANKKIHNDHWETVQDSCHPCSMKWDAILRVETMERDGFLVTRRLAGVVRNRTLVPVAHSHDPKLNRATFSHTWRQLPEYKDVNQQHVTKLLRFYKRDMEMFGFQWDADKQTAFCQIKTENGICC